MVLFYQLKGIEIFPYKTVCLVKALHPFSTPPVFHEMIKKKTVQANNLVTSV